MAELIAALSTGDVGALGVVLRQAYATGRAQRGVVRSVLQLATSSDTPVSVRCTAYEVLWTLAAAVDVSAYRNLVALARQDMFSADHPDLSIAALSTLRSLPAYLAVDIMLGEDVERQMSDAMCGDAQPHVRAASVHTFTRLAFHAWMQGSDVRSVGSSRPFDSYAAHTRVRTLLQERCSEVLRAVCACCEDKEVDVCAAGYGALRALLEAAPYAALSAAGSEGVVGLQPLLSSYAARDSLLATCESGSRGSGGGHGEEAGAWDALAYRVPHRRMVVEVVRRIMPRIGHLMQRLAGLRAGPRAHAIRVLTLVLAHALAGNGARTGPLDGQATARMDYAGSTGEQPLAAVVTAFLQTVLLPAITQPCAPGGVGYAGGLLSCAAPESSCAPLTATHVLQLEACRAYVQLAATFSSVDAQQAGRADAGAAAVRDLACVSGGSASGPLQAGQVTARALAGGALAVDTTITYPLSTLASMEGQDYDGYSGSLWPVIGGNGALARATPAAVAITAAWVRQGGQAVLACCARLCKRVGQGGLAGSGSAAGVIVHTAGVDSTSAEVSGAGGEEGSGSGGQGGVGGSSSSTAAAHGAAPGLGSGSGTSAMADGLLHQILLVSTRCLELCPASLFLSSCPALLREYGRLADGVVDDAGLGRNHSGRRVELAMRTCAMAVHAALVEWVPPRPLHQYSRGDRGGRSGQAGAREGEQQEGGIHANATPALSTLLAWILYEASRPLGAAAAGMSSLLGASGQGGGGGLGLGSGPYPPLSPVAGPPPPTTPTPSAGVGSGAGAVSAVQAGGSVPPEELGEVHRGEVSLVSGRYRAEVTACMLQALARAAPTHATLGPLALASSAGHRGAGAAAFALSSPSARLACAEALHGWLSFALDTLHASLWLLEARLGYLGVVGAYAASPAAGGSREEAVAILAKVMGWPDAPVPCPAPVPCVPPPSASVTGMLLGQGPGRGGDQTVGAQAELLDPSMTGSSSSSGSSGSGLGAQGSIPGWAWARQYEAVGEAAEAWTGLLASTAALLLPPATPGTYIPGAQEGSGVAIPTALALDILPPPVLCSHRAGLQRVLHLVSRQDLAVSRMLELERAAHATAPRLASSIPPGAPSASMVKRKSYDLLPSCVPLQLRLLWCLCAAWDGGDGGALTAGVAAAGTAAALALPPPLQAVVRPGEGGGGALAGQLHSVAKAERWAAGGAGQGEGEGEEEQEGAQEDRDSGEAAKGLSSEDALYRNTLLSVESLRQKRLATLVLLLCAEVGSALGVGADLEVAARRAALVTQALAQGKAVPSAQEMDALLGIGSGGSAGGGGGGQGGGAGAVRGRGAGKGAAGGSSAATPSKGDPSLWNRGSKIGKALGFFFTRGGGSGGRGGKGAAARASQAAVRTYTGEGIVVTQAHFWVLLDMLVQLAACQRCTAVLVKHSMECMLVQPKLSVEVATALLASLPRLSLHAAVYGRSAVAKQLAAIAAEAEVALKPDACLRAIRDAVDSTGVFMAVAGIAHACAEGDPWALALYTPGQAITTEGAVGDNTAPGTVRAMQGQLAAMREAAAPSAPVAALELLADLYTQAPLALLALAALPELSSGSAGVGLMRSNAAGAAMRTVPPISRAHAPSLATAAATLSLHLGPATHGTVPRPLAGRTGTALPLPYLGAVPAEVVVGGGVDSGSGDDRGGSVLALLLSDRPKGTPPLLLHAIHRPRAALSAPLEGQCDYAQRVYDALVATHALDPTLSSSLVPAPASNATPLSALARALHGPGQGGMALPGPCVVSSSSDPLLLTIGHTYHGDSTRLTLHLSVTNVTAMRIPPGMRIVLHLGGPLMFDRAGVTAATVTSAATRLTSTGAVEGGGGGGGSEYISMTRTSQHHATHTLSSPLPGGATVTWDVVVSVSGFGSATVRPVCIFECVTVDAGEEGVGAGGAVTMARATRAVGAGAGEEQVADEEETGGADFGPTGAGTGPGGCTSDWATQLTGEPLPTGADGLIWTGPGLDTGVSTGGEGGAAAAAAAAASGDAASTAAAAAASGAGRFLPALPGPGVKIMRSSALSYGEIAGPEGRKKGRTGLAALLFGAGGGSKGGKAGAAPATAPATAMGTSSPAGGGSSSKGGGAGGGGLAGSTSGRKPSSASLATGADREGTEADAVSTVQGSAAGGDDGEGGSVGEGEGADLDSGDATTSLRPYKVTRLELAGTVYRLPAWLFLSPLQHRLPAPLALALAVGVDILPGAATAYGYSGVCSGLAAACVDGGGMVLATAQAITAASSLPPLPNALFAGVAARAPYAHYALAMSQPFMACLPQPGPGPEGEGEGRAGAEGVPEAVAPHGSLPMASPAWLPALLQSCLGSQGWGRVPLPVAPALAPRVHGGGVGSGGGLGDRVAALAASATGTRAGEGKLLGLYAAGGVSQACFAARTPGGATIVLFTTGILVPALPSAHMGAAALGGKAATAPWTTSAQPVAWQVSVQLRSDDARVRAVLATDCAELVHCMSGGRLTLLTHGHSPSPLSALQRVDILAGGVAPGVDAGEAGEGTPSAPPPPPPVATSIAGLALGQLQDASAGMQARLVAEAQGWVGGGVGLLQLTGAPAGVRKQVQVQVAGEDGPVPAPQGEPMEAEEAEEEEQGMLAMLEPSFA